MRRILLIAPVATPHDVITSPQFAARDYFDDVPDEALSEVPVHAPGTWWRSSAVPQVRLGRAPRLGEHTDEVRGRRRSWRPDAPDRQRRRPAATPLDGVSRCST